MECAYYVLHITNPRGVPQGGDGVIPRWNEFLPDKTLVSRGGDRLHDAGIVDLLRVVDLVTARITGRVVVSDIVLVLLQPHNHIALHDLHVVDVEQDL